MNKTVLIVAAHSDDEALGCSGTMAKHIAAGDKIHVLFMTDGVSSRYIDDNEASLRKAASEKAAEILGVSSMKNLVFPDNKMDSVPLLYVAQAIEKVISDLQPEIIYTHHIGDLNVDHQITHKAVMTACRPQPGFCVKEIYAFEVLSSTEWQTPGLMTFIPTVFIDVSDYIQMKRRVLEIYQDEMQQSPHSRSIDNVIRNNQVRGHSVGMMFAECYQQVRCLK